MLQPHGNIHGIIASAVADSAAGYAAQTLVAADADIVTVECKINYLVPGVGTTICACGEALRVRRTLFVGSADVYAHNDDETLLFAHMVATMMAISA